MIEPLKKNQTPKLPKNRNASNERNVFKKQHQVTKENFYPGDNSKYKRMQQKLDQAMESPKF